MEHSAPGTEDPFDLQRFVDAQRGVHEVALSELRAGRKASHWMWFVFPQVGGLGSSPMARRYAIGSAAEAAAYLAHPVLGARLRECTEAMNALLSNNAKDVLGSVDAMKFHSSMTLFAEVAGPESPFGKALEKFFAGRRDPQTLAFLDAPS